MSSIILLNLISLAYSAVILTGHQPIIQKPYVTIAPDGSAETITPIVTFINGAASTLSPIPEFVTKTSVYTSEDEDGHVSTATGTAPLASATSSNGAGAFIKCHNPQGINGPFCSPQDGAQVDLGGTYYITWYPRWFSSPDQIVRVQGSYFETGLPDNVGDTIAFLSGNITAERGFYVWNVDEETIFSNSNITLSLTYIITDNSSITDTIKGPTVKVVKAASSSGGYAIANETNRAVTIAIPIALIGISVVITSLWFYLRKRRSAVANALSNHWPGRQRHNIHHSRSQRTDRFANSKTAGGTVVGLWDTWIETPSDSRSVSTKGMRHHETERR